MAEGYDGLTDKEKATLRLMARGHDAKSAALALGLSVHTINERLRAARRKLAVTSSREAARMVLERESEPSKNLVDEDLRDAGARVRGDRRAVPETRHTGGWGKGRMAALLIGAFLMSVLAAALLLTTPLALDGAGGPQTETPAREESLERAARAWLDLVEARDWDASYAATARSFREANTLELWSATAESVHGPLGPIVSRQFLGADDVPSPQGITIVRFRSDYSERRGVTETLSMVDEDGVWKVAGIYVS